MLTHQEFMWRVLKNVLLFGDDYGGITAECRICEEPAPTRTGKKHVKLGYCEGGDMTELMATILGHVGTKHGIVYGSIK